MQVMGLSRDDQMEIFSAVAAVLHLGNVQFAEDGNYAKVLPETSESLQTPLKDTSYLLLSNNYSTYRTGELPD
jgi:myosin heavy subunit